MASPFLDSCIERKEDGVICGAIYIRVGQHVESWNLVLTRIAPAIWNGEALRADRKGEVLMIFGGNAAGDSTARSRLHIASDYSEIIG